MSLKIAVIGNTGMNIGAAVAGDMALAGHDVRFLLWPDQLECLEACRAVGWGFSPSAALLRALSFEVSSIPY